jgi:bacteriocin biosynthesis cyclodehydratase domain-containing protein
MNARHVAYYYLAPGIDVVPLNDHQLLLRSDTRAIRIEGSFARVLMERVLPLLDGQHSFDEVAAHLPDLPADELCQRLDALVQAQVLYQTDRARQIGTDDEQILAPLLTMLDNIGIAAPTANNLLRQARIMIVGLEAHGAHLAAILAKCGIGSLVLVDPYPCQPGNLSLMPLIGPQAIGVPREQAVQAALHRQGVTTEIVIGGDEALTHGRIATLAAGSCIVVGCFDKGFAATNHWINQVGLEQGIPTLYAELRSHMGWIGPLVVPDETACYMCYRMRSIACEENLSAAIAFEEFLKRQQRPALHERGVLPMLPPYSASLLALEILKQVLNLNPLVLTNTIVEFNGLSFQSTAHPVLQKPDCPICKKKHVSGSILHARNCVTAL